MIILKRLLLILITPLLAFSLLGIAFDFAVLHIVGQPDSVKHLISESGIYNDITKSALEQAQKSGSTGNSTLFGNQLVVNAANQTFTPQLLQTNTNQAIDGIYVWLNGQTASPNFKIDLTAAKTNFANTVERQVAAAAASLLPCTRANMPSSFDALDATCLPPGVTSAQVGAQAKNSILNAQGFMDQPVITPADFKGSQPNQDIFQDQLKSAPQAYRQAKQTPYVLIILALLIGAGIVFLSSNRLRGLRHIGIITLAVGFLLVLISLGLNAAARRAVQSDISTNNALIQADVQKLVKEVVNSGAQTVKLFGVGYMVIGTGSIIAPAFIRRGAGGRSAESKPETDPLKAANPKPAKGKKINVG